LQEAVKAAKNMKDGGLVIAPFGDDFGGQMQLDAVTLGDMQYFKLVNNVRNVFALTLKEAQDFVSGDVAKMQNRSRMFKNATHRKGVAGWNHDMEYALRHYLNYAARYIAMDTLKHDGINLFERTFGRYRSEHKGLANYTKQFLDAALGNPGKIEETLNNLVRNSWIGRHVKDYIGDRPATMLSSSAAGLIAIAKLGFWNISSAAMNFTQILGTAAKIGYGPTAAAMAEYAGNLARPNFATMRLYRETGVEDNISMENPSGYSKIHQIRGKLTGMSLFRAADGMARKVTVIGAYRKALAEGKNKNAAIEYAKEVNDDVNFDYSVVGAPHFMRQLGPIGTLMFQFKKYGIKELELISKMNGKERAKLLVPMLLLSGIFGAPGGDALKAFIDLLIPGDDDRDLEMEIKKWVSETSLPDLVKKTILYGALSNLGIDIGRRVGMGDFIPSELSDFTGPTFSTIYRTWNAVPKIFDDGNFFDMIEAVSPGLANPIKAIVGEGGRVSSTRPQAKKWREPRGHARFENPSRATP
jgi:hypothetical protein